LAAKWLDRNNLLARSQSVAPVPVEVDETGIRKNHTMALDLLWSIYFGFQIHQIAEL
jgi:hypothetical protein